MPRKLKVQDLETLKRDLETLSTEELKRKYGVSRATLWRYKQRLLKSEPTTPLETSQPQTEAELPAIEIKPPELVEIPKTEEEIAPEIPEKPEELLIPEKPPEKPVTPEFEVCKGIIERSINRLLNAVSKGITKRPEMRFDEDEARDTATLLGLWLARRSVDIEKYALEVATGLHFGSMIFNKIAEYKLLKEKEKEEKAKIETEVKKPIAEEIATTEAPKSFSELLDKIA